MKVSKINMSIDVRIAIARNLPDDLQDMVWKTYNDTYVLPYLMLDVDKKLHNNEFENVYDKISVLTKNAATTLFQLSSRHNMFFKICMDVAEDRICDSCITPTELGMLSMYQSIQENITHPHLLQLGLLGECDAMTSYYKNKIEGITDSLAILDKLFNMIVPCDIRDAMLLDIF